MYCDRPGFHFYPDLFPPKRVCSRHAHRACPITMRSFSRPLLLQLACHAVTGLLLLCLPVFKWKVPWWDLPRSELLPLVVLLGAYGVSALAVIAFVPADGLRSARRALAITLSIFSVALLLLLLARWNLPRYLLLPVFAAATVVSP